MGLRDKRRFFVGAIIVSVIIILLNVAIVVNTGSLIWKNPLVAGNVSLTINPPTVIVPPSPGGGGGGGGRVIKEIAYDFELDQTVLKVFLKQGAFIDRIVQIINPNNIELNFDILLSDGLGGKVFVSEESFVLERSNAKDLNFKFVAGDELEPGVYTGNILFKTEYSEKTLLVIFEVVSKVVAFEVDLDTPAEYKNVQPGEELFFQITAKSVGDTKSGDLFLRYWVKDFNDKIIVDVSEYVHVDGQISFGKTLLLPEGIMQGDYVVSVIGEFDSGVSVSSEVFSVGDGESLARFFLAWLWALLIGVFILLIVIWRELKKLRVKKFVKEGPAQMAAVRKKIVLGQLNKINVGEELKKLRRQRELLEEAFNGGYVKKDSYEKSKSKIAGMLRKLREKYS